MSPVAASHPSRCAGPVLENPASAADSLAAMFLATLAEHGERAALIDGDAVIDYATLYVLAAQQARALQRQGAGPGRFVGLWTPRGREVLIAQIAIALTGAAWVPFDADAPPERIRECLDDVAALGVVCPAEWRGKLDSSLKALSLDGQDDDPALADIAIDGSAPAYVIYTSGSTGKPKGIVVSQANICHFLRAARQAYGLTSQDRMLQSASIAFDLSLEEIWLPLSIGAALVVCPAATLADPERLRALTTAQQVTAMDVVPTLLALLDADLPSVRTIIVGGEACPDAVVKRYAVPGRRLINSYGPSETTVAVTAVDLAPCVPITIGTPLAGTTSYVVDEEMRLLPRGSEGELLIGGAQVAQGYVGRPDLTAEKFIANPFDDRATTPVLYRTGDAVVMREDGDLEFRGRIDDQVKLRGFRVELGEIESRLAREPGIAQAAVVVHKGQGFDQLVGFVTLNPGAMLETAAIRQSLRGQLPPYMVPTVIEAVAALPRLAASGKVDRKALANLPLAEAASVADGEVRTPTEAALVELARPLFPGQAIDPDADFFLDMGGHSLLAAQFITAARQVPALAHLTLSDMYEGRHLRGIAAIIDRYQGPQVTQVRTHARPSLQRRFWCGVAQAIAMPFVVTLMSAPWLAIFISYALISPDETPWFLDLAIVFGAYALINVAVALFTVAMKWLIVGRIKPGRYPLWGSYYFRVWLVQRMLMAVHLKWMQNTPVLRGYLRLMGAKVGDGALISDFDIGAIDLVEFGADCTTGSKTVFANAQVEGADFVIERIVIGRDASIGSTCVLRSGAVIEDGAELEDVTSVDTGMRIPAWTRWSGSPAQKVADLAPDALAAPPAESTAGRWARNVFYFIMLAFIPGVSVVPVVPAFRLMEWIDDRYVQPLVKVHYLWYMPAISMIAAAGMVVFTLLLTVALRWLVLPRVRAGTYSMHSGFHLRRWSINLLIECALDTLSSLFATLYMRVWYRAMGTKVGHGTEISTTFAGRYELIELGDNNFIADDVVMGDDEMRRGWLTLDTLRTGDQVFIGNEAVVPQGYVIESGALIGVKSRPPAGGHVAAGETWFGSPPIRLPVRQRFEHDVRATYQPPRRMLVWRALYEAFNVCLPVALFITAATLILKVMEPTFERGHWMASFAICVAASMLINLVQLLVAVAYKWLLMGRYTPTTKPMWSWWALRTEATSVMYWGMAGKALLEAFRGTLFLPWALRLFGTKTGKGVYLDSADITEFDSVSIGDFAAINNHACLQTHLYEDRLMKTGTITIGRGAVVGAGSTVLYHTDVGEDARLGPLTMVMKGESIPAHSSFGGSPARPVPGDATGG